MAAPRILTFLFHEPYLCLMARLGYHVLELARQGYDVSVVDSDVAVAKLALEGPLGESSVPLDIGDPDALVATSPYAPD